MGVWGFEGLGAWDLQVEAGRLARALTRECQCDRQLLDQRQALQPGGGMRAEVDGCKFRLRVASLGVVSVQFSVFSV